MKRLRTLLFLIVLAVTVFMLSSCWNYRLLEDMAIVAGLAIDKAGSGNELELTVEIAEVSGGRERKMSPKTITMTGDTMFDAIRNIISLSGKRLYWSHAKAVIISEDVARDGVIKILDWLNRDAEARSDINIMVSRGISAKEVLETKSPTEDVVSYDLEDMLGNEKSLSKAPKTEIWELTNDLMSPGIMASAAAVQLANSNSDIVPEIQGMALFNTDKLVGFLDGEDTKYVIFVKNKIKGGVLVQKESDETGVLPVALEIFKNKTSVKPVIAGDNVEIKIDVETMAAIDEIQGSRNFMDDKERLTLEADASRMLKNKIESVIKKVQKEYGSDIFGFGAVIRGDMPKVWKELEDDWNEKFRELDVTVNASVKIRNSALQSKPIEMGD